MMNHSFNTDYAELYGIEEAIILENIAFWIKKNETNNKNFYDGYTWTYNSAESFNKLFPYITPSKIRRCLLKLEELEVLKSGNYNKSNYDKTKWYTIINVEVSTFYKLQNGNYKMENGLYNLENRTEQNVEPIPDINSNINTDIKTNINNTDIKEIIDFLNLKTNSNYKHTTEATVKIINARLKEGYTLEDFKTVIDKKTKQWLNDEKMSNFLRPLTLFGTKFESYLNEKDVKTEVKEKKIFTKQIGNYKIQSL